MLGIVHNGGPAELIFGRVATLAQQLGFENCAYGRRSPFSGVRPQVVMLSNYPAHWRARYESLGYLEKDPTVLHGQRSQTPLRWSDAVFSSTPHFWEDARAFGLRFGWSQSSLDAPGIGGMLTLCRSSEELTASEMANSESRMQLLSSIAHQALSRALANTPAITPVCLTPREIEVMKWTAEGRPSQEVAKRLLLSKATVDFHARNATLKLGVPNKTAAAVRATMLGLLR